MTLPEGVFLLDGLPPRHSNRLSRLNSAPKLHVGDTGVACAVLSRDAAALWDDRTLLGQVTETFVYQELRQLAEWREDEFRFHHFRDRDGFEVDLVLERAGGRIAGVEVKAGATVTAAASTPATPESCAGCPPVSRTPGRRGRRCRAVGRRASRA